MCVCFFFHVSSLLTDVVRRPSKLTWPELNAATGFAILHASSKKNKLLATLANDPANKALLKEEMIDAVQQWSDQCSGKTPTAVLVHMTERAKSASGVRRRLVCRHFEQAGLLRAESPALNSIKAALWWPLAYGCGGPTLKAAELDAIVEFVQQGGPVSDSCDSAGQRGEAVGLGVYFFIEGLFVTNCY